AFDPVSVSKEELAQLHLSAFPVLDPESGKKMQEAIFRARETGDSLGGIIECAVRGLPAGWGGPLFGGLEGLISRTVFAVPAVKGIEFGAGFAAASLRGSEANDPFTMVSGKVRTKTNNHGGILGGISTGMPLVFRAAVKPTPSIALEQETVNLAKGCDTTISISGRHDPCIVPRAVPCIEAAAAIALCDTWLDRKKEY
ncbi:MAG: chorismate synthase, partial [Clostridia bacterium]|nr:chorismate synthase [Clostridia bacterium]